MRNHLHLDNFHNSFEENTPVAKIMSLQITPLYGLCVYPVTVTSTIKNLKLNVDFYLIQTFVLSIIFLLVIIIITNAT